MMAMRKMVRTQRWSKPTLELLEERCLLAAAVALSNGNLIQFDTASPNVVSAPLPVTGLIAGETLVGIDYRPMNNFLYGLGVNAGADTATLYAISTRTGAAGVLGAASGIAVAGLPDPATVGYGVDFNPAFDRLRVVAGNLNFRVDPNTGALAGVDSAINGATTSVDGTAYTNNQQFTLVTTQYVISAATDQLFIQSPPNSGTTALIGALGIDVSAVNGFDILPGVNVATDGATAVGSGFAAFNVSGATRLYTINLNSGAATLVGAIGTGATPIQGLTILSDLVPDSRPSVAIIGSAFFLFNTATPASGVGLAFSGVIAGETLVGIDYRPATGQLYGLGINGGANTGTLYLLDPRNAGASFISSTSNVAFTGIDFPDATVGWGVDFNPTVDRLRVTTADGLNFRVSPITGAPIDGNFGASGSIAGTNPDGFINGLPAGSTGVAATAYTNNFGGATVTTQYTLDATSNSLFIQNPPNVGTQTVQVPVTLGGAPLDITAINGFDIYPSARTLTAGAPTSGLGLAALAVSGGSSNIYEINLISGVARLLGPVVSAPALSGLAVGDAVDLPRDTVGAFDAGTATWYLRNSNSSGAPDAGQFQYGGVNWIPVVGDWNGDGRSTVGAFDPSTATWYLRNSNDSGAPDAGQFQFGGVGWFPVVGDWDGNGTTTIGVVDPSTGLWHLKNSNSAGAPDIGPFAYGAPGWRPVSGDWNGDGFTTIGAVDPSNTWYLRNSNNSGAPDAGQFQFGGAGWRPVTGDWDRNGSTTIGAVNPQNTWFLRNSNNSGAPDAGQFAYGAPGWGPVAGDHNFPAAPLVATARGDLSDATLADSALRGIVSAALARLADAGVDPQVTQRLAETQFTVGSLPGLHLGLAFSGNRVVIDADAAGHGWFVDPTPLEDGDLFSGMDLLSTVLHEMGHQAGLGHDALGEDLQSGQRFLALDAFFHLEM